MPDGASIFDGSWRTGWRPDPRLTVSQWADRHRVLSAKSSAEPGHWRTSRVPYAREPMDKLSPSDPAEVVVLMWAAQTSKTECGNNWLGYVIHHAPGPMMLVQPTVDTAKRLSKQRIAPMLVETPVLSERVADNRSRDSGNTLLVKEFPGGVLIITGANSAIGLRSMPVRFLFLDEVDAYPVDVEGEGDPVSLAKKRTTTFNRRKILETSTPTVKDFSRIERSFEASDKRRYFVPCPSCNHMQWLRWRGMGDDDARRDAAVFRLVWKDEENDVAAYICEECGALIEERHKTWMLERGEWRPTAPGDGRVVGYHLSALYSPLGWKSWAEILREWKEAAHDAALLKTFVNTVLAETWEEAYSARVTAEQVAGRAEMYELLHVPERGLCITAGIDVQDNRVEVVQRAWGEGEESWLVNYSVIHGDPGGSVLWQQVWDLLQMEFQHESGAKLRTLVSCVDSGGHFTNEVYAFARVHRRAHVLAIKGMSIPGRPAIGKPTKQDINYRNQVIPRGVLLWPVGTDTIKQTIYARLRNPEPGPGFYHFPLGVTDDYYSQITAERQVTRFVNGMPKRIWIKKDSERNEALDCEVYAYAALQYLYTRVNRATIFAQLRRRILAGVPAEQQPAALAEPPAVDVAVAPRRTAPTRRRNSWVKGWRR